MITLINPPGIKTFSGLQMHSPNPPIGLAYIAGALKEAGFQYTVIDATGSGLDEVHDYPGRSDFLIQGLSMEQIVARIPAQTRVVGISCNFSTQWPVTRMVADAVRAAFPQILLVLGGEHGTAVWQHVMANSPFDVIVRGEGEEAFIALLNAHRDGQPFDTVPGVAFRRGEDLVETGLAPRKREVDQIALPDWQSFPIENYIDRHQLSGVNLGRSMPLLSTRGCPYQCSFCSNPNMWTRRWIPRDPKAVVNEMEMYIKAYKVTNFDLQDLTAVVNRRWALEFCDEITRRGLKITWQMPSGTRTETFDAEVAAALYRSGCRALAFAPESGDPETLRQVKKQVDLVKLVESAKIALDAGLTLSCFFVIGFPDDTTASLRKSAKLIRRLAFIGVHDVAVSKFVPYPGSEYFKRLQDEGKIGLDDSFFVSPMDFYTAAAPSYSSAISTRRLYWTMLWLFTNFYVLSFLCRPLRVARILLKAVLFGQQETRYAKWFVDRFYTRRQWRKLHSQGSAN